MNFEICVRPMPTLIIGTRNRYPFRLMDVGDQFTVPHRCEKSVRNAAHMWGKRKSQQYAVRKLDSGICVWRAA